MRKGKKSPHTQVCSSLGGKGKTEVWEPVMIGYKG